MSNRHFPVAPYPSLGPVVRTPLSALQLGNAAAPALIGVASSVVAASGRIPQWTGYALQFGDRPQDVNQQHLLYFCPRSSIADGTRPSRWDIEGSVAAAEGSGLDVHNTSGESRRFFVLPRPVVYTPIRSQLLMHATISVSAYLASAANAPYPRALFNPRLIAWQRLNGQGHGGFWYVGGSPVKNETSSAVRPGYLPQHVYAEQRSFAAATIVGPSPSNVGWGPSSPGLAGFVSAHHLPWDYYSYSVIPRVADVPWEYHSASVEVWTVVDLADFALGAQDGDTVYPTLCLELRDFGVDQLLLSDNMYVGLQLDLYDSYRQMWRPFGQS